MPVVSIPIMLDKERHIRFSFKALCRLEETLGVPIAKIGEILGGSIRLNDIAAVLYAGLADEDSSLTLDSTKDIIDASRLVDVAEAIRKAFEGAFAREAEPGELKKA